MHPNEKPKGIVAEVTPMEGKPGFLVVVDHHKSGFRHWLKGDREYATVFTTEREANQAVEAFRQEWGKNATARLFELRENGHIFPLHQNKPKTEDVQSPTTEKSIKVEAPEPTLTPSESPRIPPNEAIMAMFRNRLKDLGTALERLGRSIDEKHLDFLFSPYASAAMAGKAIADFADLFDSIIEGLPARPHNKEQHYQEEPEEGLKNAL